MFDPQLGLSILVTRRSVAHVVKQFSTGEIYIFCNRFFGLAPSGEVIPWTSAEAAGELPVCPKCLSAVETTCERMRVIAGIPPNSDS